MILVTGATGHLGSATVDFLLKKLPASRIAAFARDERKAADLKEKGVEVRVGSYDDVASLDKAMRGIEKVLLIASNNEENRLEQHRNVVDAAKKASVRCVAYTGRSLKDRNALVNRLMDSHFETEDYIKQSGLSYVLFRNALYMDTIPQFVGETVFETGINLPAGDGAVSYALRREMGEAIANALAEEGDCGNRIYQLTGSKAHAFADVAAALSELSGKTVKYTSIKKSAFETGMKERGVPEPVIEKVAGFITDIKNGQEAETTFELENLLGRKPASLKAGLKTLLKL